ncbi:cytochrome C oxidase subunit IV family protein [Salinithrix halophila]|uniref:Cytochrome C oxidase subunit IV family protein n=1 Tax=Salinithrix halophila TaxID=1485204 RepID=A0ABV8JG39_9BACL
MAQIQKSTVEKTERPDGYTGEAKYLLSFVWMILLTAAAFVLVSTKAIPVSYLVPVLLILAALQVVLQLFTFMHLKEKGSQYAIMFMGGGCFVAATCIVAMLFWV